MYMKSGIGVVFLASGFIGSVAMADVVTETLTFTDAFSAVLEYSGFDASLGTLTGVKAVLDGRAIIAGGQITGTTGGEWPDLFSVYADGYLTVSGSGLIRLYSYLRGVPVSCHPSDVCTVTYPGLDDFLADMDSAEILSDSRELEVLI
jgi:hypothetical protein